MTGTRRDSGRTPRAFTRHLVVVALIILGLGIALVASMIADGGVPGRIWTDDSRLRELLMMCFLMATAYFLGLVMAEPLLQEKGRDNDNQI